MDDKIISGRLIAKSIDEETKKMVLSARIKPSLTVVLVGNNPDSRAYIRQKKKRSELLDIAFALQIIPEDADITELLTCIKDLNNDNTVTGIIVQMPLPAVFIEKNKDVFPSSDISRFVIDAINPIKDVDGLTSVNIAKYVTGDTTGFRPATPQGIMAILDSKGYALKGKKVVVIGRSMIVGKPVMFLLLERGASVTLLHSQSEDIAAYTKQADVVIAAAGVRSMIKGDMIKKGSFLIDVGMTAIPGKGFGGDIDTEDVLPECAYVTPVPGGVGPLTVSFLMRNVVMAASHD